MSEGLILEIKQLTKTYTSGFLFGKREGVRAVNEVSFSIPEKPIVLGLVGESGSGKSTIAKLILDLISPSSGEILYRGKNIANISKDEYKAYRREVQGIFQDPYSAVNPLRRVGYIFKILIQKIADSKQEAGKLVKNVLKDVGLNEDFLNKYPHQLSGGELQRILIARAFLFRPKTIVADEPVSMLDASLRATVLTLMLDMKEKYETSFLYITHDLSTAYYMADDMIVLYRGCIVEHGKSDFIVKNPKHPYTRALIKSIPIQDPSRRWTDRIDISKLEVEVGGVKGCKFYGRCQEATNMCKQGNPPLIKVEQGHSVACFLYSNR